MQREHCVCMSGVSERQVTLIRLDGAIEVVEWLTNCAYQAHAGPASIGDPKKTAQLEQFRLQLVAFREFCRVNGWQGGQS